MTHTLTVVVPAHNEAAGIRGCLDALLHQSEPIEEIIVVDNASTDDTAEIVAQYAPRVKLIHEPRPGVAYARSTGFDAATGDIIGRADADTRVRPEWSAALKHYFADQAHDQVGAVTGMNNSYDSPFRAIKAAVTALQIERGKMGRLLVNMHGANCAIRNTTWQKVRGEVSMRGDIFEDFDLALCVHKSGESIAQLTDMWADISPRRALTDPIRYTRYAWGGVRTCRMHEFTGARVWAGIYLNVAAFWVAHLLIWLPYRAYDPARRRFTMKRLLTGRDNRPLPVGRTTVR